VVISVFDELITPTLVAASTVVCGTNDIVLTASTENGANVNYEWFIQDEDGELLALRTTTTPTIIIGNASAANSGEYVVRATRADCVSGFSNTVQLTVLDVSTEISASNNSSENNQLCEGDIIQLSVPFFDGAIYTWFGPAGFTSDQPNPIIAPATSINEGAYFAVINIEGCLVLTKEIKLVTNGLMPLQMP